MKLTNTLPQNSLSIGRTAHTMQTGNTKNRLTSYADTPFGPTGPSSRQAPQTSSGVLGALVGGKMSTAVAGLMLGLGMMMSANVYAAKATDINRHSDNSGTYTVRCSDGQKKHISKDSHGKYHVGSRKAGRAHSHQLDAANKACNPPRSKAKKSCEKKKYRSSAKPTDLNRQARKKSGKYVYTVRCSDGKKGTVSVTPQQQQKNVQMGEAKRFCSNR